MVPQHTVIIVIMKSSESAQEIQDEIEFECDAIAKARRKTSMKSIRFLWMVKRKNVIPYPKIIGTLWFFNYVAACVPLEER